MNKSGLTSVIVSFVILFFGAYLDGISFGQLIQGHAAMMVLGLSVTAVMLHHTGPQCIDALVKLKEIFIPTPTTFHKEIISYKEHSKDIRLNGVLHFETMADLEKDVVIKRVLMMAADGFKVDQIKPIAKRQIDNENKRLLTSSSVYEALGGYSPTMGILGAVLGLMKVMANMDDPSQLGSGIATAFVATIYGVFFANTIFLPLGNHFRIRAVNLTAYREMLLDGIISLLKQTPLDRMEASMASFIPSTEIEPEPETEPVPEDDRTADSEEAVA